MLISHLLCLRQSRDRVCSKTLNTNQHTESSPLLFTKNVQNVLVGKNLSYLPHGCLRARTVVLLCDVLCVTILWSLICSCCVCSHHPHQPTGSRPAQQCLVCVISWGVRSGLCDFRGGGGGSVVLSKTWWVIWVIFGGGDKFWVYCTNDHHKLYWLVYYMVHKNPTLVSLDKMHRM
jgi:hypothetical protein